MENWRILQFISRLLLLAIYSDVVAPEIGMIVFTSCGQQDFEHCCKGQELTFYMNGVCYQLHCGASGQLTFSQAQLECSKLGMRLAQIRSADVAQKFGSFYSYNTPGAGTTFANWIATPNNISAYSSLSGMKTTDGFMTMSVLNVNYSQPCLYIDSEDPASVVIASNLPCEYQLCFYCESDGVVHKGCGQYLTAVTSYVATVLVVYFSCTLRINNEL